MIFPLDICCEILLRLPVESLFRCRAVCKQWRTFIDDPSFARAHTNNINQLSSHTVFIRNELGPPFDPLWTFDLDAVNFSDEGLQEISGSSLDLTYNELNLLRNSFTVSECNGLILVLTLHAKTLLEIWNLSTHERLQLPRPQLAGREYLKGKLNIGLGYDYTTQDFKAVLIENNQTHVFSLRSDSWRNIGVLPFHWGWRPRDGVFLRGALHWISPFYNKIIALDLGTEKYRQIQMPIVQNKLDYKYPYALSGCLFLSGLVVSEEDPFDVWVMKNYGADDSWIKLFSIKNDPTIYLKPIAFMKDTNQVFLMDGRSGFILFDVKSNSMKRAHIHGLTRSLSAQNIPRSLYRLHDHCGSSGRSRIRSLYCPMKMKVSMTIQRLTIDSGDDEEVSTLAEQLGRVSPATT